jgi:DNA topoisomerase-1
LKYSKTKGKYIQCSNSECNYKEELKKDSGEEE